MAKIRNGGRGTLTPTRILVHARGGRVLFGNHGTVWDDGRIAAAWDGVWSMVSDYTEG